MATDVRGAQGGELKGEMSGRITLAVRFVALVTSERPSDQISSGLRLSRQSTPVRSPAHVRNSLDSIGLAMSSMGMAAAQGHLNAGSSGVTSPSPGSSIPARQLLRHRVCARMFAV